MIESFLLFNGLRGGLPPVCKKVGYMRLHRIHRNIHGIRDFLVTHSACDQLKHFEFSGAEICFFEGFLFGSECMLTSNKYLALYNGFFFYD